MNFQQPLFVVAIVENETVQGYYAIDQESGYPYFPDDLPSAKFFKVKEDAINLAQDLGIKSDTAQKPSSGGTIYPDSDIHRALKLNNKKKSAKGEAVVLEVNLGLLLSVPIHGEIKEPTGYTYA